MCVDIFNAIPMSLKRAMGIGLFIALIGFSNAGIIVQGEGPSRTGQFTNQRKFDSFGGLLIMALLMAKMLRRFAIRYYRINCLKSDSGGPCTGKRLVSTASILAPVD